MKKARTRWLIIGGLAAAYVLTRKKGIATDPKGFFDHALQQWKQANPQPAGSLFSQTNNPGNILHIDSSIQAYPGSTGYVQREINGTLYRYRKYATLQAGRRALVDLLSKNYVNNPNYNDPYKLVGRYVTGNPLAFGLAEYRQAVADALGIKMTNTITPSATNLAKIAAVIARFEGTERVPFTDYL